MTSYDKAFVLVGLPLGVLGFLVSIYFFITSVEQSKRSVQDYCQPRGAIGGSLDKYAGAFCIMRDGTYVRVPEGALK